MKYYMVTEGDSSGKHHLWTYYVMSDASTEDDAREMYSDENPWVRIESDRIYLYCSELSETEYKAGLQFNEYYRIQYDDSSALIMFRENMFPRKDWAIMFANPNKPVRIGYPNMHMVYRMNIDKDGNKTLSYQYDYCAKKFGVLKAFEKAYPV